MRSNKKEGGRRRPNVVWMLRPLDPLVHKLGQGCSVGDALEPIPGNMRGSAINVGRGALARDIVDADGSTFEVEARLGGGVELARVKVLG